MQNGEKHVFKTKTNSTAGTKLYGQRPPLFVSLHLNTKFLFSYDAFSGIFDMFDIF